MWAVASSPNLLPIFNVSKTTARPANTSSVSVSVSVSVSANLQGRQRRNAAAADDSSSGDEEIGGLGHAVLTALKSNNDPKPPNSRPKQSQSQKQKQKQNREGELEGERQISGSDVLWALQRASAAQKNRIMKKKKMKKKGSVSGLKKSSSNGDEEDEDEGEDYSNVRALNIKKDWATKLDDLERRLQELSCHFE